MCIIYSSYKQHLTNKRKERQTTEKSTVGSEAQRRWELLECKWVLTSAAHAHQTAGGTGSSCFSETRLPSATTEETQHKLTAADDCWSLSWSMFHKDLSQFVLTKDRGTCIVWTVKSIEETEICDVELNKSNQMFLTEGS